MRLRKSTIAAYYGGAIARGRIHTQRSRTRSTHASELPVLSRKRRRLGFKSLLIITTRLLICKPGLGEYKGRPAAMPSRVFRLRREGRHCLVAGVLAFFARRDEWVPLRCVAFHKWIFLGRFSTIEAFFKTFKCRRAAIKRHPQCGALGAHLKAICRSKP